MQVWLWVEVWMNVCNIYPPPTPHPNPASLHGFCVHPLPPHPFLFSFFSLCKFVCVCFVWFCCFCGFSVSSKWDIQYIAEVLSLTIQTENCSMMAACLFLYLTIHIILPFFCGCMCCLFAQQPPPPPPPPPPPSPPPPTPKLKKKDLYVCKYISVAYIMCKERKTLL